MIEATKLTSCRMCGGGLHREFSLRPTPIANAFAAEPDAKAQKFPLELAQCTACHHVQLFHSIPDAVLWSNYLYSPPPEASAHHDDLALVLRASYPSARSVLEIGANNGSLLRAMRRSGLTAYGIDPVATGDGNAVGSFSEAWAKEYESKFDLIVSCNTFAHIADLRDLFRGIERLLAPDGAVVFEVQYLPNLMARGAFDMIYHEHRDYHTIKPWHPFLSDFGLMLDRVDHIDTHGGSIRMHCTREKQAAGWAPEMDGAPMDWNGFYGRVEAERVRLNDAIEDARMYDTVRVYGAPAKACTLIHHFELADRLSYCIDSTPAKQGRYIPGTGIKIFPPSVLGQSKSSKVFLLSAWNFADVIRRKHPDLEFIVPFERQPVLTT